MGTYRGAALDALDDPTRRAIFERLGKGPCAVGQLAADLPVSRPAVSQHLEVLEQAGLVTHEAVGTRRVYRLNPIGIDCACTSRDSGPPRCRLSRTKPSGGPPKQRATDQEQS